jgi:hypothetical protein
VPIRSVLPHAELWDTLRGLGPGAEDEETEIVEFMDADSAKIVITGQKAAQLSYLRKHAKVDLAVLRDLFAPKRRALKRCSTKNNPADMMTNAMKDTGDFQKNRELLGIVDGAYYLKFELDLGPFPERDEVKSFLRKAAAAVIPAAASIARATLAHIVNDGESQGRVARWLLRRTLG